MLPGYDAKAIAEVLGLAFLLRSELQTTDVPISKQDRRRSKMLPRRTGDAFAITVDGDLLVVIDAKSRLVPSPTPAGSPEVASEAGDGLSPPSFALIDKAVENGLPRTALRHVAMRLAGGDQTRISSLEWGVVPKTTLERRDVKLSVHESERTERIARLFVHALRALGTEEEASEFMTATHPELDGRSPLDSAKTDLGTRRVERLLTGLEYGLAL